ncbi:MAG: L,D-transpeptidase family protein [Methyloceanibacter sp.]|jgi:hypothetical protein
MRVLPPFSLCRRRFLVGSAAIAFAPALLRQSFAARVAEGQVLQPGDYFWNPERSQSGPVAIVVSIPDQRVTVYRGGQVIAVSTCSTGKPGHETPTGTFTILEKAKVHHSSTYSGAPMPNMERLTWSGVALHAGDLPGYPASHGCVRLPREFSALLYTVTLVGTTVTITSSHVTPPPVRHDGLVLAKHHSSENTAAANTLAGKTLPAPHHSENKVPPLAVIVSSADKRIVVIEHDRPVAEGTAFIADPHRPLGSHVFVLAGSGAYGQGLLWHVISHGTTPGAAVSAADSNLIQRISGEPGVVQAMKARMHPGMVLITTDQPISAATRSASGFSIITEDDS